MSETNLALASLMPRPQATQDMASVADMMRARAMMPYQQQQLQAQTQGIQAHIPVEQQQAEELRIENQMQRQLLGAYSDPDIWKAPAPAAAPSGGAAPVSNETAEPSVQADDPVSMINGLFERAATKYNPIIAQKVVAPFLEHYKTMQDMTVKQQDVYTKAHADLRDRLVSVKNSENQPEALANLQTELKENPPPGWPPNELQEIENLKPEHLDATINALGFSSAVAEASSKKTAALKGQQETAVPTDQQRQDAISTISTYKAIPPEMQQGFVKELQDAPTLAAQQKIQDRADKASESFQRSADARAQAETMADVEKRKAVQLLAVKDDQDLSAKLQSSQGIRGLLDMSKNGNQQATQAALVRFAEHEVVEGGVKRFNETELKALGSGTGTAWRQLEAWYDKGAKGKLPEMTNAEMGQILDMEDEQSRSVHAQNISTLSSRMGVKLKNPQTPKTTPAKPAVTVGQTVSIKGKSMKVTAVHPDGSFDAK